VDVSKVVANVAPGIMDNNHRSDVAFGETLLKQHLQVMVLVIIDGDYKDSIRLQQSASEK
jgi:hypothetical protein